MNRVLLSIFTFFLCFGGLNKAYAQSKVDQSGTEFWFGVLSNNGSAATYTVLISSSYNTSGKVSIPGKGWDTTFTVKADSVKLILLPSYAVNDNSTAGTPRNLGVKVESELPVSIYLLNLDATTSVPFSADASNILPISLIPLKPDFYISQYKETGNSQVLIVAPEDNTQFEITPSKTIRSPLMIAGNTYTITLNSGQTFFISDTAKLGGTRIRIVNSCKRINVLTGAECTQIGFCAACDHTFSQALPTSVLGKNYMLLPFSQNNGGYMAQIVTTQPSTTIYVNDTLLGTYPTAGTAIMINAVSAITKKIVSTQPIVVGQFMKGQSCNSNFNSSRLSDPAFNVVNSLEQMVKKSLITSFSGTAFLSDQHYINVLTKRRDTSVFLLDGRKLLATQWLPLIRDTTYLYAIVKVTPGNHLITSDSGFSSFAYGYAKNISYFYGSGSSYENLSSSFDFTRANKCPNTEVTLTSTKPGADVYKWFFDNGDSTIGDEVKHTYSDTGLYPVKYVFKSGNCVDTVKKYVEVHKGPNTIMPKELCVEDKVKLEARFDTSFKYNWNTGDTANFIMVTTPGQYTLITTDTSTKCTTFDTTQVYKGSKPQVTISVDTLRKCFNNNYNSISSSVTINQLKDTLRGRYWYVNDVLIDSTNTFRYVHPTTGEKRIKVVTLSKGSCKDSAKFSFTVNPNPKAAFKSSDTSRCFKGNYFEFTDTTASVNTFPYTIVWRLGDKDTATLPAAVVKKTYTNYGIYNVRQVLTSDSSCKDSITIPIRVKENPAAAFTVTNVKPYCVQDQFSFSNTSIFNSGSLTYKWFTDKDSFAIKDLQHKYGKHGNYEVKLVAITNGNCTDTTVKNIRVNALPKAAFSINDTMPCYKGHKFVLQDVASLDTGNYTVKWFYGDGKDTTTIDSVTVNKTYAAFGNYTIKQLITSDSNCRDSISKNVKVRETPVASFTLADPLSQCFATHKFNFSNTSTASSSPTYAWDMGDGSKFTTKNTSYSYARYGTYQVKMVTTTASCKDSFLMKVYVNPEPDARFTINGDSIQCYKGHQFVLQDVASLDTGNYTVKWFYGDGKDTATIDSVTVNKTYAAFGNYTIKQLITSDSNCRDSISKNVKVKETPVAGFTLANPVSQCFATHKFNFSNTSTASSALSYAWDMGDGNKFSTKDTGYSYAGYGTYDVKMVTTSALCKDSFLMKVYVNPEPDAGFTVNGDSLQCITGNLYAFFDDSKIAKGTYTINWKLSDGSTFGNTTTVNHTYTDTGAQQIRLYVKSDSNCMDSADHWVFVANMPAKDFAVNDRGQCYRNNSFVMAYNGHLPYTSMYWETGDGHTYYYPDTTITHHFNAPGVYHAKLVAQHTVCKDSSLFDLYVNPHPAAAFYFKDPVNCFKQQPYEFIDSTSILSGSFVSTVYFGDGKQQNNFTTVKHSYITFGNYIAKLVAVSDSACKDSTTKTFTLHESPKTLIEINKTSQCFNDNELVLQPAVNVTSSENYTVNWFISDNHTVLAQNSIHHSVAAPGIYTVKMQAVTDYFCEDSAFVKVYVNPSPVPDFEVKSICENEVAEFKNLSKVSSGAIAKVTWLIEKSPIAITYNASQLFKESGYYDAKLIVTTDSGCTEDTIKTDVLEVSKKPTSSFEYAKSDDDLQEFSWKFTNTSTGATSHVWYFSDNTSSVADEVYKKSSDTITLKIYLVARASTGCSDTSYLSLFIHPEQVVYMPTAFTPNKDDVNDQFKPEGIRFAYQYELVIINRWGEMVFSSTDPNKGWDGTFSGRFDAPEGIYTYSINLIHLTRKREVFKGTFYLLR